MISAIKFVFIPISSFSWWFITAYVLLILLHPIVNRVIVLVNKRGFGILIFYAWLFWYAIGDFFAVHYYPIQRGLFFYLLGAYIRKFHILKRENESVGEKRTIRLLAILIFTIIVFTIISYLSNLYYIKAESTVITKFILRLSSTFKTAGLIPIGAVAFFIVMGSINMNVNVGINQISASVLGIYLIHDSIFCRSIIWRGISHVDTLFFNPLFPVIAIGIIVLVFVICSLLDEFRLLFLEPIMLKKWYKMKSELMRRYIENR